LITDGKAFDTAEDVILPLADVPSTDKFHPAETAVGFFSFGYNKEGITEWDIYSSYAKAFAFGAYLMRNYGGPELFKNIIFNAATGIDSMTEALNQYSPCMTFEKALIRFAEALIFSSYRMLEDAAILDRTVTNNIKGIDYTVYGFDVWSGHTWRTPYIYDLTQMDMRQHSLSIHSTDEWKNKSGSFSITLEKPDDPNVVLYLMAK
jgi:hypothetical protein